MISAGTGVITLGCGAPFALGHHLGLGSFRNLRVAGLTQVVSGLRFSLLPAQSLELQPLHRAAVGTRQANVAKKLGART